jgi:hypothetical protein
MSSRKFILMSLFFFERTDTGCAYFIDKEDDYLDKSLEAIFLY